MRNPTVAVKCACVARVTNEGMRGAPYRPRLAIDRCRLCESAPELLAALRELMGAVDDYVGMGGEDPVGPQVRRDALSAIARAEGR